MTTIRTLCGALGGAILLAGTSAAQSEAWPTRPVQAVSPFSAGNATDIVARVVLDEVSKELGQPFVIENRPGAGGSVGAASVARAEPDGYTVLLYSASLSSQSVLHKALPFDPIRDFAPVALFGIQPSVLVAAPSKGWKSVADLIAAAKAKPGSLNYASAGIGSASHLAPERLRLAANIETQHVPFRGPVEALTEVMAGRIDFYYLPILPAIPNIKSGKVVALAVSTPKRAPQLPDVPTIIEAGYPTAQYLFWNGLAFPAKTPRPIVDKLHAATDKALKTKAVQDRLATLGVQPMPMSVAEFAKFVQDDIASMIQLAKDINLKPIN
jgi:tripartite-type tricarboxylate transporter receptor subunit TctC